MLETLLTILGLFTTLVSSTLVLMSLFSRKFRLRIVRTLLGDYSQLQTYVEMGQISGDVRAKAKVKEIVSGGMMKLIPKILNNPLLQIGYDFFMSETELGTLIESEPDRYVPLLLSVLMEFSKNMPDMSVLLSQFGQGFNPSSLTQPSDSDRNQNNQWWNK